MSLFAAMTPTAPLWAQATEAQCTCDMEDAGDAENGAKVANAAACFLTKDENRDWCDFDVESLKGSQSHQQNAAVVQALSLESSDELSAFFNAKFQRYLSVPRVGEDLQLRFDVSVDDLLGQAEERILSNAELLTFCLSGFGERSGGTDGYEGGDQISCGVHPETGWFAMKLAFSNFDLVYLLAPLSE